MNNKYHTAWKGKVEKKKKININQSFSPNSP